MAISTTTSGTEDLANKGQPNGYASLDSLGKVPRSELDINDIRGGKIIKTVSDFPAPVGGFIELENNQLYIIEGNFLDITATAPNGFKVPAICTLVSNSISSNFLQYTGSGTMFTGTAVDRFAVSMLLVGSSQTKLFDIVMAPLGVFKVVFLNVGTMVSFDDGGEIKGADVIQFDNFLFSDFNKPLTFNNCLNTILTNLQLIAGNNVGASGSISAFTDPGGGVTQVTTTVDHNLVSLQKVDITGSGVGAYDDVHVITVIDATNYTIPVGFVSDPATGTFVSVSGVNSGRGDAFIELKGVCNLFVLSTAPCTPAVSDSFLNIDPDITINAIEVSNAPFSKALGGLFFKPGVTGAITAFADPGGGETTVTSVGHGRTTGDTLSIKGSGVVDYDKGFSIIVTDVDNFKIPVAFVSNPATGTWDTGSLDETEIRSDYRHNGNQKDSVTVVNAYLNTPETVTINTQGVYEASALAKINWPCTIEERIRNLGMGTFEYTGLRPATVRINLTSTIAKEGGGVDQISQALFYQDVSEMSPSFVLQPETVSNTENASPTTVMSHVNITLDTGDQVQMRWANLDGTANVVVDIATLSIKD